MNTPVYAFTLEIHQIMFKYISTAVPASYEIAVVAAGPLSNIVAFLSMVACAYIWVQVQ